MRARLDCLVDELEGDERKTLCPKKPLRWGRADIQDSREPGIGIVPPTLDGEDESVGEEGARGNHDRFWWSHLNVDWPNRVGEGIIDPEGEAPPGRQGQPRD